MIDVSAWGWPQWTVIAGLALHLIYSGRNDGKPKGNISFTATLITVLLMLCAFIAIGFFK